MKRATMAVSMLSSILLASCAGDTQRGEPEAPLGQGVVVEGGEYRDITVPELQAMLANKDFPLVNVHIPFEGDLPATDASIPFNEIESHLDKLPADKHARIVLYCRTGRMSAEAAAALVKHGYTDVYNLTGGFRAWSEAGLPLAGG